MMGYTNELSEETGMALEEIADYLGMDVKGAVWFAAIYANLVPGNGLSGYILKYHCELLEYALEKGAGYCLDLQGYAESLKDDPDHDEDNEEWDEDAVEVVNILLAHGASQE